MSSQYRYARLKFCDDKVASDPQYIFQALDWIERLAVVSTFYFTERKQFQADDTLGCLQN